MQPPPAKNQKNKQNKQNKINHKPKNPKKPRNSEKFHVFHMYFSALGDLFSPFFFAVVSMAPCFAEIWGNDQKPSIFLDWEQVGTYKLLRGKQKFKGDIQTWTWAPGDAV